MEVQEQKDNVPQRFKDQLLSCCMGPVDRKQIVFCGFLKKKSRDGNRWQKRYFILYKQTLIYYKSEADELCSGALTLCGSTITKNQTDGKETIEILSRLSYSYAHSSDKEESRDRVFYLRASKKVVSLEDWYRALVKQNTEIENNKTPIVNLGQPSWVL